MKLQFSITPATFILILCMIATTPLVPLSASLCAAAIHEFGHIIAAKLLSIDLTHMRLDVLGARLNTTGRLYAYSEMTMLCFAGPLINFLCFALSFPFSGTAFWLAEFSLSSLSLGLLNLLPIDGFDGGRILHGLLCRFLPLRVAERMILVLSFCCIFLLWAISVWLLLRTGSSLTLFVFSCCLFCMLFV